MSIENLRKLFGTQETAVLELVELEDGVLALRHSDAADKAPLVKIEFNDDIKALIGSNIPAVAQHMIQAAFFAVMEQQVRRWKAEVVDEQPAYYS